MSALPIALLDHDSTAIAGLNVQWNGERYRGTIALDDTPLAIRDLFGEFETTVEGRLFALVDEVEDRIAALALKVVDADGVEFPVEDLQVYPSTRKVSFRTRQNSAHVSAWPSRADPVPRPVN
jgi:hypothetical protein